VKKTLYGAAVLASAAVLALGGCAKDSTDSSGSGTPASPTASPSPKPSELLAAAVTKTVAQSFTFKLGDSTDSFDGQYDSASKGAEMTLEDEGQKISVVVIGTDVYLGAAGQVRHYDGTKFQDTGGLAVLTDPVLPLALLATAQDVKKTADGFSGTFDASKVPTSDAAAAHLGGLIAKAGASGPIPFTTKVDAQGNLTEFKTTLPKVDQGKDSEYLFTITKFGSVTVAKPTGKVTEAAPDDYKPGSGT
jgi:hypothetical protein